METKKILELLETRYDHEIILSLIYSPEDKKLNIVYEIVTGSRYIDKYIYNIEYDALMYLSTECIKKARL